MAIFFEHTNRLVLPNWRSFSNTAKIGELNGSRRARIEKSFNPDISDLIEDWTDMETVATAGDLLGAALVCNKENDESVANAARFIKNNPELATKELLNTAELILNQDSKRSEPILDAENVESFQERANLFFVYEKINNLKRKLKQNPQNAIGWTEIARYYAILGQNDKARRAILNGIHLSPENRFVIRSMARFFAHYGDPALAHDIIRRLPITRFDPWIMATEISLATKRGRFSKFAKQGFVLSDSSDFHPFNIAELNSSLGTLEMSSNFKKSKKLFEKSLIQPNDNVLAQAEWASHQERNFLKFNPANFKVANNFEANARNSSENGNFQDSVDYAKLWFLDMPFSRGAVLFGSQIAANNLNNHEEAVFLYKAGLTSHPHDPQMLNNIMYSLCLSNRLEEAERYWNNFSTLEKSTVQNEICITATKGLFHFRKGNSDIGRKLYSDAIERAVITKNHNLANQAFVNYIREELMAGNSIEEEMNRKLEQLKEKSKDFLVCKTIKEIEEIRKGVE